MVSVCNHCPDFCGKYQKDSKLSESTATNYNLIYVENGNMILEIIQLTHVATMRYYMYTTNSLHRSKARNLEASAELAVFDHHWVLVCH